MRIASLSWNHGPSPSYRQETSSSSCGVTRPQTFTEKVKELDKKATGQEVGWGPEFCGPNILQTGTLGWNLGRNGALYQSQLKARGIGSTTAVWTMAPTRLK